MGKTNIINSVVKQNFQSTYLTVKSYLIKTLGIEFSTFEMKVKDSNYILQLNLLDATGFSIFRDLVNTQVNLMLIKVKDVNFIVYCFDVTNKESFNSIKLWKDSLKEYVQNKKCIEILVGNKVDLEKKIVVTENEVKVLANQYNMKYFLVSAVIPF